MLEVGKQMMTRRNLIRGASVGLFGAAGAAVLAACGETQIVEKIVTREVIKEVPVETIVTRDVIKEVPVETIVTRDVIKEVPVETIVTRDVIKEVIKEVPVTTEKVVTVEKIVPVEVEKVVTIEKVVTVEKTVPVEVVKIVEVPTSVQAGQPVRGGDLRVSWGGGIAGASFNSYTQISSDQAIVNVEVGTSLIHGGSWGDGPFASLETRFGDGVAKSYEEVLPEESYIFHLDERFTFHDGAPVTADDFMYTFHIVTHPDWGVGYGARQLEQLKGFKAWGENPTDNIEDSGGVKKIDNMTIQLTTDGVQEPFWASPNPMQPMPKHIYETLDPATAFDTTALQPVGNGPFKFERFVDQQFAELSRNDDYPYGAPWVDRYIVRYGDPSALDAATEAGELDFLRTSSVEGYARLAGLPHMQAQPMRSPFASLIFLNHNVFAEKWPDVNVSLMTEAMVIGADRESIANNVMAGTLFVDDYQFSHIRFMQDVPMDAYRALPFNAEAGKALLEESGWNPDDTLTWLGWFAPRPQDLALMANWLDIGLKVEFERVDRAVVVEHLWETGANEMVVSNLGGSQDVGDAFRRMGCDSIWPNGYNYHHTCFPEIDALYQTAFDAPNKAALKEAWIEISRHLHGRGTMLAGQLWKHSLLFLYHRRVSGPWWMNNYAVPARRPTHRVWVDPRWSGRDYVG